MMGFGFETKFYAETNGKTKQLFQQLGSRLSSKKIWPTKQNRKSAPKMLTYERTVLTNVQFRWREAGVCYTSSTIT
jgi:hypothetical protein